MAQYLPLPDGNSLLMKEGETPQEAYARAQRQFPNSFKRAEPEKKEPTIGGQTKEFFKGLAPGAINLVESAAIGASSLLKDDTEKAARSGIASLASAAKKPFEAEAGYDDTRWSTRCGGLHAVAAGRSWRWPVRSSRAP